jgi:hypothetical protein
MLSGLTQRREDAKTERILCALAALREACGIAAVLGMCIVAVGCGSGERVASTPIQPALTELLVHYDETYDPAEHMLREAFRSPGYHTQIETGATVHPTRESLIYALALLQRGNADDSDRAADIIRKVLTLQDVDPSSPTCGVWPWLLEEPLTEMAKPDLNWADFCGAQLVQMLIRHSDQLPTDLTQDMRASLRHAVDAIRRRNVAPGYSNIAILGGGVCAAAGELLGDRDLVIYGRSRLQSVVAHTVKHGGFSEYNSPPYAKVVISECERTLQLVQDLATREAADSLRQTAWQMIAESFHPGTQQWAGPHSRTSRVRLLHGTVDFLARRVQSPMKTHPTMQDGKPRGYAVVQPLPCPELFATKFQRLTQKPYQIQRAFVRARDWKNSRTGTTWFSQEACLGSVNRSTFWTQRKPLIAYWRTEADPAVVFRLRFLHNGKDFASMGVQTSQNGPAALSVLYSVAGRGDWHPSLDRPNDGVFHATDMRMRYELQGRDVRVRDLGDHRFELAAGDCRIVVHAGPGRFHGRDVVWEAGEKSDTVFVDGICHRGASESFKFNQPLDISVTAGIELLRRSERHADSTPRTKVRGQGVAATWELSNGETLTVPSQSPRSH